MKIYLAQIDTTVGDLEGNARKIIAGIEAAKRLGAGIAVFPELAITGYPPRDLLEKRSFVRANLSALARVAASAEGVAAIVGFVEPNETPSGNWLYNCAAVCEGGRVVRKVAKRLLPTYDVFDEDRHFEPGVEPGIIEIGGQTLGLSICEDAWTDPIVFGRGLYSADPIGELAGRGARAFINISASPFALGRPAYRESLFSGHAAKHRTPLVYVNLVGGNDELLFDGRSLVLDREGRTVAALAAFREDAALVELDDPVRVLFRSPPAGVGSAPYAPGSARGRGSQAAEAQASSASTSALGANAGAGSDADARDAFDALVMGTRDYAAKCSFEHAVIGLSGGIDSSVVAAIAVEALGANSVTGVAMPSRYTSEASSRDAAILARNLGIEILTLPIEKPFTAYLETLAGTFAGRPTDVTEENLQARTRGTLLMALSNKFGWLVLTTGNKSETAVGYCTLYGDMSGGLAVLADVPKTLAYRIAAHINREREVIPREIFTKPPSAELKPGQCDQDSLPPYDVLDGILKLYVEDLRSVKEIVAVGYDEATVRDVVRRVDANEYKRKQAPPGLRITTKAFGLGRRMPIAQRYVEP